MYIGLQSFVSLTFAGEHRINRMCGSACAIYSTIIRVLQEKMCEMKVKQKTKYIIMISIGRYLLVYISV